MDGTTSIATQPMGTWLIILLLFLFLLGGNNGFGFGGNGNANAFLAGVASQDKGPSAAELLINNNTMWQNQLLNQQNLANQSQIMSTGFCNVSQGIDRVVYEGAKNTADIIAAGTANTQKILDMMCSNTITQLRTDLAEARVNADNAAQTATLMSVLRPYPTPAYTVSSPYESLTPSTTA